MRHDLHGRPLFRVPRPGSRLRAYGLRAKPGCGTALPESRVPSPESRVLAHQSGFTLLEMIVVLVIIGLIMGLVGPRLFSQADKAKVQTAQTQIKMLSGALQTMRLDISRFPTAEEGLALLTRRPADERTAQSWTGPYLDEAVPMDPWNNPYQYAPATSGERPFTLYSFGADGKPGGEGFDADVGYLPGN